MLWKYEVSNSLPSQVWGWGRWIFKYNSFQGPEFLSENVSKEKCLRMHCKQNLLKSLLKPTYAFCTFQLIVKS